MSYKNNNQEKLELQKKYESALAVKEILKSNESDAVINTKLKKFGVKLFAPTLPGIPRK